MKFTKFFSAAVLAGALTFGLTACGDDEPAGGDGGNNGGAGTGNTEIVTPNVPASLGWSGNTTDGTLTYTVENEADYSDGEANSYYAFKMKDGLCQDAAYNVVFGSETMASQVAQMLKDGSWATDEDDESEDYGYMKANRAAKSIAATVSPKALRAAIASKSLSRADAPVIPVLVKGKVIYIFINGLEGLQADELKEVISYWTGDGGYVSVPDKFIFGNWNEQTGVYTCDNLLALGINYKVETGFASTGFLNKFATTITCPNSYWASMMYEEFLDTADSYEQMFGKRPVVKLNGNSVTVNAIIIGEVAKDDVIALLMAYDWMLNMPFFCQIFD